MKKICTKCNNEKEIECFYKHKRGHYISVCKICVSDDSKKRYKINSEKIKERVNEWLKNNPERGKEIRKKSREKPENRKRSNEYSKKRRKEKPHIDKEYRETHKIERNKRDKERRLSDPLYNFSHKMTVIIGKSFKNNGFNKNNRKTEDILGCTIEEFKLHLETNFDSWMNWANRGLYNGELNYGWDIDHIIPISSAKTEEDVIRLNHYTNLRPLCSKINRDIKKNKINY